MVQQRTETVSILALEQDILRVQFVAGLQDIRHVPLAGVIIRGNFQG